MIFWKFYFDPSALLSGPYKEAISLSLEKLFESTKSGKPSKKKTNTLENILALKLNKKGRLVVLSSNNDGKSCLILLSAFESHDKYEKYLSSTKLSNDIKNAKILLNNPKDVKPIKTFASNTKASTTTQGTEKNILIEEHSIYSFNDRPIVLTKTQGNALTSTLPLIIRGPAGSGKTSTAMILLQQKIDEFKLLSVNPNHSLPKILVVCKSRYLAEAIQLNYQQTVSQNHHIQVEITHYEQLFLQSNPDNLKPVGIRHFLKWYEEDKKSDPWFKHFKKNQLLKISALYNELKIIASLSDNDKYIELGRNQSRQNKPIESHKNNSKEALLILYEKYLKHLEGRFIDLALCPIKTTLSYDFVLIDEGQDLSRIQLQSIINQAKRSPIDLKRQVCISMDIVQALTDSLSDTTFLRNTLTGIQEINLPISFRTPPTVSRCANAILEIQNIVCKGRLNKEQYLKYRSCHNETDDGSVVIIEESEFEHHKKTLKNLTTSPNTAVVVPHSDYKKEAIEQLDTPLVFTPKEIKGLEYKNIVAYKLFDGPDFEKINTKFRQSIQNGQMINPHLSKQKDGLQYESMTLPLNHIFVALTRATSQLIFLQDKTKNNNSVFNYLEQSINSTHAQYTVANVVSQETTSDKNLEKQWLDEASRLVRQGKKIQAETISKKYGFSLKKSGILKTEQFNAAGENMPPMITSADTLILQEKKSSNQNTISSGPQDKNHVSSQSKKHRDLNKKKRASKRNKPSKHNVRMTNNRTNLKKQKAIVDKTLLEKIKNEYEERKKISLDNKRYIESHNVYFENIIKKLSKAKAKDKLKKYINTAIVSNKLGKSYALHWTSTLNLKILAQTLIMYGADINIVDFTKQTPLAMAFLFNHIDMFELLLKNGANPNVNNMLEQSLLSLAVKKGCLRTVKLLIQYGASFDNLDKNGLSFINTAYMEGHAEIVKYGLQKLSLKTINHQKVLEYVVYLQRYHSVLRNRDNKTIYPFINEVDEKVQALINNNEEVSFLKGYPFTIIQWCAVSGNIKLTQDILRRFPNIDINETHKEQSATPLSLSVECINEEITQILLLRKANPFLTYNEYYPIHIAAQIGNINIFKLLLAYSNCSINLTCEDRLKYTPLQMALLYPSDEDFIGWLLKQPKVNLKVKDQFDSSILHLAAYSNLKKTIEKILETKIIDINKTNLNEDTPLHIAVYKNNTNAVETLLRAGAKINIKNKKGETPTSYAQEKLPKIAALIKNIVKDIDHSKPYNDSINISKQRETLFSTHENKKSTKNVSSESPEYKCN